MSDSVRPHRRQPTRLSRPWDSPGKNTGVGCHCLLQCMKVKSESEVAQSCPTLSNPMGCSLSGSSTHGIFQARVLEWVAIASCLCSKCTCRGTNYMAQKIKMWSGFPSDNSSFNSAHTNFFPPCFSETKLPTSIVSSKKQESSRITSTSALLMMPKLFTVWITTNCGKFWKRWEYQTTWPVS